MKTYITMGIASFILLTGCTSYVNNNLPTCGIDKSSNVYLFKGFPLSNTTLKTMLKNLSRYEGVTYIYKGKDILLPDSSNFYILSIEDLQDYVKMTTNYILDIKKTNKPGIVYVDLHYKHDNPFLQRFNIKIHGKGTLYDVFNKIAQQVGYKLMYSNDVDDLFNDKVSSINFSGKRLIDFIEYIQYSKNIFVDIDTDKKILRIYRYKNINFELPLFSDKYFNNVNRNDSGFSYGSYNIVDIVSDMSNDLRVLTDNRFNISGSMNRLIIKSDYIHFEDISGYVNDYIDDMNREIELDFKIYKTTVDSKYIDSIEKIINERSNWLVEDNFERFEKLLCQKGSIIKKEEFHSRAIPYLPITYSTESGLLINITPKLLKKRDAVTLTIKTPFKIDSNNIIVKNGYSRILMTFKEGRYNYFIVVKNRIKYNDI